MYWIIVVETKLYVIGSKMASLPQLALFEQTLGTGLQNSCIVGFKFFYLDMLFISLAVYHSKVKGIKGSDTVGIRHPRTPSYLHPLHCSTPLIFDILKL